MATIKGGEKFEAKMLELAKKLNRKETLRVGFLEGSVNQDGISIPMYAAVNNYGAPSRGIPPRPFFTNMVAEKSSQWPDIIAAKLKASDYDMDKTLTAMGELIVGQLQDSIYNGAYIPLKQATIDRKGFAQPLVDTTDMVNSAKFEIKT